MTNRAKIAAISCAVTLALAACTPTASSGDDPGTGGAANTTGTGGQPGSGGSPAGTGGSGSGGTPAGTGGSASATGGQPGTGGQSPTSSGSPGTGGASSADASAPADTASAPGTVADPGTEGDGNTTMNGPFNAPPEATLQAGVTAGKLVDVPITAKVFPGVNRTVRVYIPNGYVEGTPAPFIVLQDGPGYINNFKLNTVLDNLIAKKQLPLMLAIFVPNGGSAHRSMEYDTLSDAYVRFVLEDVLPAVEAGAPVKLTTDPEGRAAGGHSSGGIAAFTMGWERPDQFRRILTHSGSFVSLRGGDKYPGIVKMAATKPLRVYMAVGTKDNEAPRWQRGNENLAAVFKEKGYHYRFVLHNGGTHAQGDSASNLPESLLWLWRGYPIK